MDRPSQTAFVNATAAAAAALGMTGYVHWDWLGDLTIGIGTNGTDAIPFLEDAARTEALEVAMVATVPDAFKPSTPPIIVGKRGSSEDVLAVVRPTSALIDGIGQWESDVSENLPPFD